MKIYITPKLFRKLLNTIQLRGKNNTALKNILKMSNECGESALMVLYLYNSSISFLGSVILFLYTFQGYYMNV